MEEEDKKNIPISDADENPLEALVNKELEKESKASHEEQAQKPEKNYNSRFERLKHWYASHKKLSIPATVLLFFLLIAAVPWTRYTAAGVVYKKDFNMQLRDSTAGTPVSEANVKLGSASGVTDGNGRVTLKDVKVGQHKATISKKHYRQTEANVLVPILSQKNIPTVELAATGRQVKVTVTNVISRQNLSGVGIKAGDIEAETDKMGNAVLVLPVGTVTQKAELSLDGYNKAEVTLQVNDKEIKDNKFNITPSGKIYFLSKKSGKIDVVKTNLDGSERQTVLAGTGREEDQGTILLASRDWKYLALLSRRDSGQPKLYLIETEDDSLSVMDEGNVTFTLVGWNDEKFIYHIDRKAVQEWQPKKFAVKSYNTSKKQLLTLDESRGEGTSDYNATYENMTQIYSIDSAVVYFKSWTSYDYYNPDKYQGKQDTVIQINADGTARRAVKTFNHDSGNGLYMSSYLYKPREIYFTLIDGNNPEKYFEYESGKLADKADLSEEFRKYNEEDPITYLLSPSGEQTFWSENRDGKSALIVGDKDGEGGKEVASLSDEHKVYGWFGNEYLVVSKKSSEVYILPRSGVKGESETLKITDYHKPSQSFFGYGGGYGGL